MTRRSPRLTLEHAPTFAIPTRALPGGERLTLTAAFAGNARLLPAASAPGPFRPS